MKKTKSIQLNLCSQHNDYQVITCGDIDIDEALWNMEAALNYTYCMGAGAAVDPESEETQIEFTANANGQLDFDAVANAYMNLANQYQAAEELLIADGKEYKLMDITNISTAEHLGGGKFANGAITGAYTVMFNHFLHEGNKEKGVSFKRKLMDYFNFWKNQFCLSTNYSEIYSDAYMNNSEAAQAGLEVRNAFSLAASTEISPYYSISVGKSSMDFGYYGSIVASGGVIYGIGGLDYTPSLSLLPASVNFSAGLIIGNKSSYTGAGYGFGGGSFIGIEYGSSFDNKVKTVGMNIGTSPIWGSGSVGYTYKF